MIQDDIMVRCNYSRSEEVIGFVAPSTYGSPDNFSIPNSRINNWTRDPNRFSSTQTVEVLV